MEHKVRPCKVCRIPSLGNSSPNHKTISPAPDEHDTAYPLPWNATNLATGLPFNVQVFCFPRSMWLDISFAMPTTEPPNVGMKKTSEMANRSQCISRTIQQVIETVPAHVIFLVLTAGGNKLMHRACVHVGGACAAPLELSS